MTPDFNDRLNSWVSEWVSEWGGDTQSSIPKHPGWYTILATFFGNIQCSQVVTEHSTLSGQEKVGWLTLSNWRVWLAKARIKESVQQVDLINITYTYYQPFCHHATCWNWLLVLAHAFSSFPECLCPLGFGNNSALYNKAYWQYDYGQVWIGQIHQFFLRVHCKKKNSKVDST